MAGTTPRGLIHPTADDKIKDGTSPSALADDFKALADSADASIAAAEGTAKSYADSGDTSTLNAAKADATAKANGAKDSAISDASAKYGGLPQRVSMLESTTRAVDAPAGFNPNDVTGQAVHTVSASDGAVNMPPSESQSLTVLTYPFGGAALQQLAYSFSIAGAEFWSRVKTTGGWSSWSRLDADKWADRLDSLDSNISMNLAAAKTYADTKKSEAIADATTKYGGLPGRIATVEASTQAIDAPVGFDANSVAKQAVHMVHTNDAAVNMPGPGSWLLRTWPQGGSALLQEAILYNGTAPEIHTRRSYEGSWSAWVRLDAGKWATRLGTIETTATQDREAALADASAKANTAKAEAIAAAASDATTKANAARDTAAADASAKAATAETNAKAYTDQVVNTSHLASDTDGTPYYSPGSMTLRVFTDTDGVPFFFEA